MILPFQVIGLEEQDKYLGLGFADSLITRLSSIKRLVVRPTGSILKYHNQERNPLDIGAVLEVQYVLDGVIMKLGDSIRVTVQGVNMLEQSSTFGEKFQVAIADFPKLQEMISEQIAQQVLMNLTPEEREILTPKHLPNA